jgi:NitT/TauT family transport system substrate-binding protein
MSPAQNKGVTIVQQGFDMNQLLKRQIDAASAMTYNELAQVLETKNPKTGKLYTIADLNVIKMQNAGVAMLEDGIFTTGKYLKDPANRATAVKFIKASLQGWIYCRNHVTDCVNIVLKQGPTLPKGHQTWQMNEINKLIWPNTSGIGLVPTSEVSKTATIAKTYGVIKKLPQGATNYTYATKALAELKAAGVDVHGSSWKPAVVKVTAGGK